MISKVLALETSCDDTSVAIVTEGGWVLSLVSKDQDLAHDPYGGIVPEIASRNHTQALLPLIEIALNKSNLKFSDLDGLVVTNRPGLIGALIVGLVTAKSLALVYELPLLGVNHLEGHLLAPFLRDQDYEPPENFSYPYVALAISGGHTSLYLVEAPRRYRVLGKTRDDAAGEVFDKFAKMVGLGFPGGPKVDQEARDGDPQAFHFPRVLFDNRSLEMSFSGLKSAAARLIESLGPEQTLKKRKDLCASFQEAVVETLWTKLERAARAFAVPRIVLTGGVSANSRLRTLATQAAAKNGFQLVVPPLRYCTDNAAMIGYAGLERLRVGESHGPDLGPSPTLWPGDFYDESP